MTWGPAQTQNSALDLHRTIPIILDRLDLNFAPAHVRDQSTADGDDNDSKMMEIQG